MSLFDDSGRQRWLNQNQHLEGTAEYFRVSHSIGMFGSYPLVPEPPVTPEQEAEYKTMLEEHAIKQGKTLGEFCRDRFGLNLDPYDGDISDVMEMMDGALYRIALQEAGLLHNPNIVKAPPVKAYRVYREMSTAGKSSG